MDRKGQASDPEVEGVVDRAWREHRRHLLDIGFRILGSVSEAEDAVQEAFARLVRADVAAIDDVGGWLVVVVSRICFDRLRSERRHPTSTLSPDGGEPGTAPDPADRITLDDNVRIALQVVLERLTPAERTAFVLHDVFQYSFDAIAEIVGRTPVACRQLASRARRTVADDVRPPRFQLESAEERLVTQRFIAACATGDLDGLLAVLAADVAGVADVGGRVGIATVTGAPAVAAAALRFLGPDRATTLLSLPAGGEVGVVALHGGRVVCFLLLTVRVGLVEHIDGLVDPVKLTSIAVALGTK